MDPVFPPEILNYSAESYYSKINTKSKAIYLSSLIFVVIVILLLPIIKIDISVQSPGIIRAPFENTMIQSSISGEIVLFDLSENKTVCSGDTLVVLSTERIDEQIALEIRKKQDNEQFIHNIEILLQKSKGTLGPKYKNEYNRYLSKLKEQQFNVDYLRKEYETAKKLFEKGVISESEYLQCKNSWEMALGQSSYIRNEYYAS